MCNCRRSGSSESMSSPTRSRTEIRRTPRLHEVSTYSMPVQYARETVLSGRSKSESSSDDGRKRQLLLSRVCSLALCLAGQVALGLPISGHDLSRHDLIVKDRTSWPEQIGRSPANKLSLQKRCLRQVRRRHPRSGCVLRASGFCQRRARVQATRQKICLFRWALSAASSARICAWTMSCRYGGTGVEAPGTRAKHFGSDDRWGATVG